MDRAPLGYYFYTTWREDGKVFANRHDFTPDQAVAAKKAHDGAMTFMWTDGKDAAQVGGMYDEFHRMARHGVRRGEVRVAVYEAVPMPADLQTLIGNFGKVNV
jgi:hypothetical protein